MTAYSLHVSDRAIRDLDRLDKSISRRIAQRIRWLAENLDRITPQPLGGEFAGLNKFRVGDYRVIYEIMRKRRAVVIHMVDHRKDVYRQR